MGRHVFEVGQAVVIPRHPIAVIFDGEVMRPLLLAAGDCDRLSVRIDAVLHEFRDRLQGIALRQCDDPDRIPVIAYAQLPAIFAFRFHVRSGELHWFYAGLRVRLPAAVA